MKSSILVVEEDRLVELLDQYFEKLIGQGKAPSDWVGEKECMALLQIRSKSTLQKLRNDQVIVYSQPSPRVIVYYRPSLEEYLRTHANKNLWT